MARLNWVEKSWILAHETTDEDAEFSFDEVAAIMKKYARAYHQEKRNKPIEKTRERWREHGVEGHILDLGSPEFKPVRVHVDNDLNIHLEDIRFSGQLAMSEAAEMFRRLASQIDALETDLIDRER